MSIYRDLDPNLRLCLLSNCADAATMLNLAQVDRQFADAFRSPSLQSPSAHPPLARAQREWWLGAVRRRSQQSGLKSWPLHALHREVEAQRQATAPRLRTVSAHEAPTVTLPGNLGDMLQVLPSPDGRWAAVRGDRGLGLVHLAGNSLTPVRMPLEAQTDPDDLWDRTHGIAFSPCGGFLATSSVRRLSLWELSDTEGAYGAVLHHVEAVPARQGERLWVALSFSDDGRHLAAAGGAFGVQVWRNWATATMQPVWHGSLPHDTRRMHCHFPPHGRPMELHVEDGSSRCLRAYDLGRRGKSSRPATPGVMNSSFSSRRALEMKLLTTGETLKTFAGDFKPIFRSLQGGNITAACFLPSKTRALAAWGAGQLSLIALEPL